MVRKSNSKEEKIQGNWIDEIAGGRIVFEDELPELREKFKEKYGRYPDKRDDKTIEVVND